MFVIDEFLNDEYHLLSLGLGSDDVLIDIGGNIGFFSVVIALAHPGLQVVALEANPLNFLLAYHNVYMNNLQDRVFVIGRPVTSNGEEFAVEYEYDNPGSSEAGDAQSHVWDRATHKELNAFHVPGVTMQEVIDAYVRKDQQFALKVDCEGCEYEIIDYLKKYRKRIKAMRGELHERPVEKALRAQHEKLQESIKFFKQMDPKFICTWCHKEIGLHELKDVKGTR
eukprot:gnl/TRDRNA2_/TRDRNA2_86629_c0_seq1.p1 gnl/TRDRNA2_/TRDRNA2_86629_c0~~gnl/TRDRNA2_/TRDRNA2_86629_c0_seq1.p1  ORF type:complete len:246 (-),score=40.93 gnl/TRDRNA2_/TRDRNA2_86629_c0_seq1:58-732(-)